MSESTPTEPLVELEHSGGSSASLEQPIDDPAAQPAPPAEPTETNDEYRARLKREADRILREKMEDFYARVGIV